MGLDIRVPIGLLFALFGVMLTLFGVFSNSAIYAQSLGVNVNLIWGLALLVFGLGMLFFGARRMMATKAAPVTGEGGGR